MRDQELSALPWDVGRPQPAVLQVEAEGLLGERILDVACGSGEHALYLAARGYEVWGVEPTSSEVLRVEQRAASQDLRVTFRVGEPLALGRLGRTFDTVLDVGAFMTLEAERRDQYTASVGRAARPGGTVVMMALAEPVPEWDLQPTTLDDLRDMFAAGWKLRDVRRETLLTTVPTPGVPALLAIASRLTGPDGEGPSLS